MQVSAWLSGSLLIVTVSAEQMPTSWTCFQFRILDLVLCTGFNRPLNREHENLFSYFIF